MILFEFNYAGMVNQIQSLEIANGISFLTGQEVLVHGLRPRGSLSNNFAGAIPHHNIYFNRHREKLTDESRQPMIYDIANIGQVQVADERIDTSDKNSVYNNVSLRWYIGGHGEPSYDETMFSGGRSRLELVNGDAVHRASGNYSTFFYGRDRALDRRISQVSFKPEYYEFANRVAKSIGPFVGGHLRLTDHVFVYGAAGRNNFSHMLPHLNSNVPTVICTDESMNPIIQENISNIDILLEEYILENFYKDFMSLPYPCETTLGLVSNLTMHHSGRFIGTSGSTYSGYIQRHRNQWAGETWEFWDNPPKANGSPYTWNGYVYPDRISWWREWPESRLDLGYN